MLPAHVFGSAEASLRQTLEAEGLDAAKERIVALALPALMLVPQRAAPKTFASQIGGDPWLPPGGWPGVPLAGAPKAAKPAAKVTKADTKPVKAATKPGKATPKEADPTLPYGLVAQIPIRDLPRIPGLEFPPRGTFWFFFNETAKPMGAVLHSDMLPADLVVRPRPDAAPTFTPRAVRYEPILTLPLPGSAAHAKLKLRGAEVARYERAVDKNCAAHSGVQLFGHPSLPELSTKTAKGADVLSQLGGKEGKDDHILILEIDGKSELGWSKPGTLYFAIPRDAFGKGQLDRAVAVIQR
jgi:hypothetical protein